MKTKLVNIDFNKELLQSKLNQGVVKIKAINDNLVGNTTKNSIVDKLRELEEENKGRYKPMHYQIQKATNLKYYQTKREQNTLVTGIIGGAVTTGIVLSSATVLTKIAGVVLTAGVAYKGLEYLNNRDQINYLQGEFAIESQLRENSKRKHQK